MGGSPAVPSSQGTGSRFPVPRPPTGGREPGNRNREDQAVRVSGLSFEVPFFPSSTKNSRQLFVDAAGRPRSVPGKLGRMSKAEIRRLALRAVEEILGTLRTSQPELLGDQDDIAVDVQVDVAELVCRVEVTRHGPKPKGRTGRGKDIDNMASTIMDALNRVAYGDDRQVADLHVWRSY